MDLDRERPSHKITYIESASLTLSLHYSKQVIKKRWSEISPSERRSIREESGVYLNQSYPFEVGNDDDFTFLDCFKSW